MTTAELHEILDREGHITLDQARQILYQLKCDASQSLINTPYEDTYLQGRYGGQVNAFYLCLDLLAKVKDPSHIPYAVLAHYGDINEIQHMTLNENDVTSLQCYDCDQDPAECYKNGVCHYTNEEI